MRTGSIWLLALAMTACGGDDPYNVVVGPYDATIHRTAYGIPHIVADDMPSLTYGTGYAFAQDHACTLADQMVKIRSERSRYFGRGESDANLNSDVSWKALKVMSQAEDLWLSLDEDLQAAVVGYAEGYNQYLRDVGPEGLPSPCRNQEWVKEITHIDMFAYYLHLGQMGSGFYLLDYIATASPPGNDRRMPPPSIQEFGARLVPKNGSNGIALGKELSESGAGIVMSNSHFEAEGERRWYELHQTIPGEVDAYGVALLGVPLVNMGFNKDVAWTHTVSTTPRFILYKLDLDPNDPTRYEYDGTYRQMTTEVVQIDILSDDGTVTPYEHTLYRSHYGPMLNAPIVGWSKAIAFSYRDINSPNLNMIPAWWDMNRATSLDELIAAQDRQGIPWVHTIAASREGEAYYADSAAAPNLTPETEQAYKDFVAADFFSRSFQAQGAWVFNGGDPAFEWTDVGTDVPFAVPPTDYPSLRTDRFAANSNENYWLASHEEPLTGFPDVFGPVDRPRQGRTKATLKFAAGIDPNIDLGTDGKFSLDELEAAMMTYPAHHADVILPEVLRRCQAQGSTPIDASGPNGTESVDLSEACRILGEWDGGLHVDARGAHIFREWLGSGIWKVGNISPFVNAGDFDDQGDLFSDAFDPADPLNTPREFLPAPTAGADPVLQALGTAVLRLTDLGIALDARLGDIQYRDKNGVRIPCPGGKEIEGSVFIADWRTSNSTLLTREHAQRGEWVNEATELTADGYPINGGDTWVSTLSWDEGGPVGSAVLLYSQSSDPDSPHFNDQAEIHGSQTLRPILFSAEDIAADPELKTITVSAKKSRRKRK
ncbi:MAG: penicillin acylase family protein [Myxococcota bacterium]